MKVLKFKCELLSDVILNQKFATEGPNQTLDFIPGNNFLGIVAGALYGKKDTTWTIFHSGKVRFGDAHPANGENRTIRIPASFMSSKAISSKRSSVRAPKGTSALEEETARRIFVMSSSG